MLCIEWMDAQRIMQIKDEGDCPDDEGVVSGISMNEILVGKGWSSKPCHACINTISPLRLDRLSLSSTTRKKCRATPDGGGAPAWVDTAGQPLAEAEKSHACALDLFRCWGAFILAITSCSRRLHNFSRTPADLDSFGDPNQHVRYEQWHEARIVGRTCLRESASLELHTTTTADSTSRTALSQSSSTSPDSPIL